MIRLQKLLSQGGVLSRRAAEEAIKAGRVAVNGVVITELGSKADPEKDTVTLDGVPVDPGREKILIALYKPPSVVTTKSDPEGRRTVLDFLPSELHHLNPVGRLDFESEGLLLLTNDGDLALHLTHPRYEIEKEYEAEMEGSISAQTLERLIVGVDLEDGPGRFLRAEVYHRTEGWSWVRVVVSEGRNRFIRRMAETVGHPVRRLKRTRHGPYDLGKLKSGTFEERRFQ